MATQGSGKYIRVFTAIIFTLSMFAAAAFAIAVYEAFREREERAQKVENLSQKLGRLRAEVRYKKEYHERLLNDDAFAQRVIRETLGYAGEREIIFKFDEKTFLQKSASGVSVETRETPNIQ